ncbi:MAG: cobalamin-binding protein [Halobacteriovoraceae bacterium]|nr:cobalamin-binding protein [Halobacteriovoraceae bacterium]|tara:strand:- start:2422 stop:3225 length:804 start_codon:yes stop_codon:yes gene_type:complete
MSELDNDVFPQKIICLTEESVETLYLLKRESLIRGVSAFAKRPDEAQKLPKVSFFTSSNYKKISALKPDLIIGHSDIQKDIARDLIELGHNVFIANHRSLTGILGYIGLLARMVAAQEAGKLLVDKLRTKLEETKKLTQNLQNKPKVYFEEWDEPLISSIQWVSELIDICGFEPIFSNRSQGILAKDRFVTHDEIIAANPDIIFACWCGKKADLKSIAMRKGYEQINAIKNGKVFELAPEVFLQPGPAPIIDGIDILLSFNYALNGE